MSVSRREWRGQESVASVTPHEVFGWRVHRHILPAGTSMVVVSARSVERSAAPNRALYVRGRGMVTNSFGGQFDDRVPGLFTGERPDHPKGTTKVTAAEELEFWCFNWHANRGALPALTPLRFPEGGVFLGQEGDRILVCAGGLGCHEPGDTLRLGGDELVAALGTYALVIGGDRV
jgi:hypothetical protein